MKASEAKLQPLIEGTKQYLVPLFQRPYSWDKTQWKTLWKDIVDLLGDDAAKSHFMGAIVTMPAHTVPEGVAKYLLIDGQQRLTTLLILLIAIRDAAKRFPGNLADKIHELFLTNKYQEATDAYKLLPTQGDREPFVSLVDQSPQSSTHLIGTAYAYFVKELTKLDGITLDSLFRIITTKLFFVSIVLSEDDNAYVIFESLNFKGKPLTEADLIRNYVLMRIHVNKQEGIFAKYWKPMQELLGPSLTEYIRHFLTMKYEHFVKKDEVYYTVKTATERLSEAELIDYLADMQHRSGHYARISCMTAEPHEGLRKRLTSLNTLDVTTAYPFLMSLYHDYEHGQIDAAAFCSLLSMVESYIIRRYVCRVPTHSLNRFFSTLYSEAKKSPAFIDGIKQELGKECPSNAEFKQQFQSRPMYGPGDQLAKARHILESLENSFGHKESVNYSTLQIEHILPRTLTEWWKSHLGSKWEVIHKELCHTIGNLTLTGFNPELSNSPLGKKQAIYSESHIELTRGVATSPHWTDVQIKERANLLAERATVVWPALGPEPQDSPEVEPIKESTETDDPAMSYSRLVSLLGGGERMPVSPAVFRLNDKKVILSTVSKHYPKEKNYWYGISPARLALCEKESCTHIAFGMGGSKVALVPYEVIKGCISSSTWNSKAKDGTIRHYHMTISSGEHPELTYSGNVSKVPLSEFIVEASSDDDTESEPPLETA